MRQALVLTLLMTAGGAWAGQVDRDWTQWGGPRRDFSVRCGPLADKWPEAGPRELWSRPLGMGHSTILYDDGRLYTMYRHPEKEQDIVIALDARSGETIWETAYDSPSKPDQLVDFGPGPHSTPLLVNGKLFTVSATARLNALDASTGKILWSHDLMAEYEASHLGRGYGGSAVDYKNLIILNVGGKDVGYAAFDQDTGEVVWKTEAFGGGYPSPFIVEIDGQPQVIVAASNNRAGLDPQTGKVLWQHTVPDKDKATMTTPLFVPPGTLFNTAAYGCGARALQIKHSGDDWQVEELWFNPKMRVQHGNVVRDGKWVYGSSGDFGPAFLCAINLEDGELAWRERGFPKSTMLLADGKLIILDEKGRLALAKTKADGIEVISEAQVLEERAWTTPTLIDQTLFLRDYKTIKALDLGPGAG